MECDIRIMVKVHYAHCRVQIISNENCACKVQLISNELS